MRSSPLDKVAFVLSVALLSMLYGIGAEAFGLFPSAVVRNAWNQIEAVAPIDLSFITGSRPNWTAPRRHHDTGATIHDRGGMQPGLTLVTSWWKNGDWHPGVHLLNREGEVVHQWAVHPSRIFSDPAEQYARREPGTVSASGTYLFPNGDLLINVTSYVGVARLDACGRVKWKRSLGTHHSITRSYDGTFWIPAGTFEPAPDSVYQGLDPTYRDRIIQLSPQGEVLNEIIVLDVLYQNGLEHFIPKFVETWRTNDLTHLNDVEPLPASLAEEYPLFDAGDLVVSLRDPNLVFVVDPETETVEWHATGPFIDQHDPDFIGEGWIGIFDNRRDYTGDGSMLGGSRIVALQPHTDSTTVLLPSDALDDFHTPVMGKWQFLENGNMLLTESRSGRVLEVSASGRLVWEWSVPPYDTRHTLEIPQASRTEVTREEVEGWRCSPN